MASAGRSSTEWRTWNSAATTSARPRWAAVQVPRNARKTSKPPPVRSGRLGVALGGIQRFEKPQREVLLTLREPLAEGERSLGKRLRPRQLQRVGDGQLGDALRERRDHRS